VSVVKVIGPNPLAGIIRFGFQPRGMGGLPTGTDFRHEFHFLSGIPNHVIRFGFQPRGGRATPNPLNLVDTTKIQLPINCVVIGDQDYEQGPSVIDDNAPDIRTRTTLASGGGGRLSSGASSFKTTTGNKGYD